MPIRQFLLIKQGKELGCWYRARSVQAIHICWKLEQELVTKGDGVHNVHILQPGISQQPEDTRERILMAVWDAVQKACCTAERKSEIDTAFEGLSNLLGSYNNDNFPLFIERLERARERDERTAKLFKKFSDKYDREQPKKTKKKHLFAIPRGEGEAQIELLVDHPPEIPALRWRLKKWCSKAAREISLRNPHFYPYPFINDLDEHLVGWPLGCLGGRTYGLEPRVKKDWTHRIEVHGDDPKGRYFRLESGNFVSIFRSTIKLEKPTRVVFRDDFGQLVTDKALGNIFIKAGDPENIKHTAWSSGTPRADALRTSELRTLEEIAKTPFLNAEATPVVTAPSQEQELQETNPTTGQQTEVQPEASAGSSVTTTALPVEDQTTPHSSDANVPPLPQVPNQTEGVPLETRPREGTRSGGETSTEGSMGRVSTSTRALPIAKDEIQSPPTFILSPAEDENRNVILSPEELSPQSAPSNERLSSPSMDAAWDSGYYSGSGSESRFGGKRDSSPTAGPSTPRNTGKPSPTKPPNGNESLSITYNPPITNAVPKRGLERSKRPPVPPLTIPPDSTAGPEARRDGSSSGPNGQDAGSRVPVPVPVAVLPSVEPITEPPQALPVPPTVRPDHGTMKPVQASQDGQLGTATIQAPYTLAQLKGRASGPKGKGIASGILIPSASVVSLLPATPGTFPEPSLGKEKKKSWLRRHIVDPVKRVMHI